MRAECVGDAGRKRNFLNVSASSAEIPHWMLLVAGFCSVAILTTKRE